jgi:hypothetical protein
MSFDFEVLWFLSYIFVPIKMPRFSNGAFTNWKYLGKPTDGIVAGSWRSYMSNCEVRLEVQTPKLNNPTFTLILQGREDKCFPVGYSTLFSQSASTNENPQYGLCHPGPDSWCKYHKHKEMQFLNPLIKIGITFKKIIMSICTAFHMLWWKQ